MLAAVHGYAGGNPAVIAQSCRPDLRRRRVISVLLSQGLDDGIIHPDQLGFPAFEAWGRRYPCNRPAALFTAAQQLAACRANAAVAWWPIEGFGHITWSCPADKAWHNRGIWTFLTKRVAPTSTIWS